MSKKTEQIVVENINVPGAENKVNAQKYLAMKKALLKILPDQSPGVTQEEMIFRVKVFLPEELFPGGKTAGWWVKTVQLDLEAKGNVMREKCKPLRWHKTGAGKNN